MQQPCKKGAGNVFDPLKNLFYRCMRVNLWVLDHHNWWVEYPQSRKPKREWQNWTHQELMRLDCIEDRPRPNLLQEEEEEVDPHLPLQNTWEEQIQMIILWPASQVKVIGMQETPVGREKTGTSKIEFTHISFYGCEC